MNLFGGLIDNGITGSIFGSNKKKGFKPQPLDDPFTAQYLEGIDASGKGAANQINATYGNGNGQAGTWLNTQQGKLQDQGWANSSLAGSYSLGNEQRRSQALLDLDNQLFAQRLQAKEAGTNSALQMFGINTQARNNYNNRRQAQRDANSQLFGNLLGTGMKIAAAPVTGGTSLLAGGLGGAAKKSDPYAGLYGNNGDVQYQSSNFMGY